MFESIANRYQGRSVWLVGLGGIGGAILELVRPVAKSVVLGDADPQRLENCLQSTAPTPVVTGAVLDVRSPESVAQWFRNAQAVAGPPDFLFYTAGVLNIEPLAQTDPALWQRAIEINLNGALYCLLEAQSLMIPRRRGSILMLASISGTKARSGTRVNPVYNTTKAGLVALVNGAAMQLRRHGIRVNALSPGPTATTMMQVQPPEVHQAIGEIMLDGRQNSADEVAQVALFVAAHGRFTGEDIPLGGGAGLGG
ncbi:MAG: SDR family NAD(P)-dependent oxidoreductase [Planctomycetaceae bacterium]